MYPAMMKTCLAVSAFALVCSLTTLAETLPHDVVKLKSQRDAKVAEIDRVFIAELEKLKTKYTKEGNHDAASGIAKLIADTHGPDPFAKTDAEKVVTRYKWGTGGELTLYGTGRAKHSAWEKDGTWRKTEDGTILLESGNGLAFKVTFDNDGVGQVKSLKDSATTTIVKKE